MAEWTRWIDLLRVRIRGPATNLMTAYALWKGPAPPPSETTLSHREERNDSIKERGGFTTRTAELHTPHRQYYNSEIRLLYRMNVDSLWRRFGLTASWYSSSFFAIILEILPSVINRSRYTIIYTALFHWLPLCLIALGHCWLIAVNDVQRHFI